MYKLLLFLWKRNHLLALALVFVSAVAGPLPKANAAEAIELGEENFDQRPKGKEADAIIGDFLMRNDKVEVVISGNLPLRRANMSTFYGEDGITPGCLYDLALKGSDNDQIVVFCPSGQRGAINYVRIREAGGKGKQAVIEVFRSGQKGGGLSVRHEYKLEDGKAGIWITSTLTNTSSKAIQRSGTADVITSFRSRGSFQGIRWFDAIDPDDKCGYAFGSSSKDEVAPSKLELAPGKSVSYRRFLAVGTSPAAAIAEVSSELGDTGLLKLSMKEEAGKALPRGRVTVQQSNARFPAYPDGQGNISLDLPAGSYQLTYQDIGRPDIAREVKLEVGKTIEASGNMSAATAVDFDVKDEKGGSVPCKVQFLVDKGDPIDLGPTDRAHGCRDQYHSEKGQFRVQVPPGNYQVIITRGPEYSHHRAKVQLEPGKVHQMEATLKRLVQSPGWVSTDYHNHSTPSGDNTCGVDDRLINLSAEQIEFAPTTEHNRLYDWKPHIDRLKLAPFLKTVPGMELTGRGAHLNAFPFRPDPRLQDGGAPVWQKDPRLNAIVLRDYQGGDPNRWVHVNHPDMVENFIDRNGDGRVDGGFAHFGNLIDAVESQNYRASQILAGAPYSVANGKIQYIREFIWLQLLNQGVPIWGVAVSDAHHVHGNGVGGWRTYVKSSTDDPSKVDWREMSRNSRAGRMILSTGPYLEVSTESGVIAGGHDSVNGSLGLNVKVQCTDWLDINRVQVLVNGRQDARYNFTRKSHPKMFADGVVKFDQKLNLKLSQDAHIIVVAVGEEGDLSTGFGSSGQARLKPIAYNNPIYVDVNGGGFQPNYDTLGFDLPVKGLDPKEIERVLKVR